MKVKVLREAGYEEALIGLSLSYYKEGEDFATWWDDDKRIRAIRRLNALAFKGGGHNKAVAAIQVWYMVTGSRSWYSEYDTYKIGTVTNSASSMHTLSHSLVTPDNFELGTSQAAIDNLNWHIENKSDITTLKDNLPEGYLQTRLTSINYMSLQNMIKQRTGHRLKYWDMFIEQLLSQIQHPELLIQV